MDVCFHLNVNVNVNVNWKVNVNSIFSRKKKVGVAPVGSISVGLSVGLSVSHAEMYTSTL